jgi:hypothetical protein
MGGEVKKQIDAIVSCLEQKNRKVIHAFLGFDACIDNIVRIVKDRDENNEAHYYANSRQFGEFLISRENRSCGIELRTQRSKIGGNMVITGNALGNLGIESECIGTFGLPDILPIFRSMSENCALHTIGETITTSALEFNDAKVMMFDPGPYDQLDWTGILKLIGEDRIKQLISSKQLVVFLNWSEIENSSQIWEGILTQIMPSVPVSTVKPYFFTDFSDCSRRSEQEIQLAIELVGRFRKYFRVILSLNQNEAEIIARALNLKESNSDEGFIKKMFIGSMADELVIHRTKDALAYDGFSFERFETFFCKEPTILTGGGDNFNAGYCLAKIRGFDLFQSLIVANAVSGYYVRSGISPTVNNLIDFLSHINV